ncbi:hypothetical protein BaRGS_00007357, partial [Batillaria attramentaria]
MFDPKDSNEGWREQNMEKNGQFPITSNRNSVFWSGSFKSDFMRTRFSPVRHQTSEELSAVLHRRHKEVDKQMEVDESSGDKRGDTRLARADRFKEAAVEDVIVDSEVAARLRVRRHETDAKNDSQVSKSDITTLDKSLEVLARVTHELDEKEASPETDRLRAPASVAQKRKNSKEAMKEAEQFITDVESRISSSLHLKEPKAGKAVTTHHASRLKEKSPSPSQTTSLSCTVSLPADDSAKKKPGWAEKETSDVTFSLSLDSDRSSSERETTSSIRTLSGSGSAREKTPDNKTDTKNATFTLSPSTYTSQSPLSPRSPTGIRRTESMKEQTSVSRSESFERKKGILKRTPSMPKQEEAPKVDPKLARIMQQRRQRELELEEAKEEEELAETGVRRQRALSAAEEIEQSIRQMKEAHNKSQEEQTEEEAALLLPVSERIFKMQSKIEEQRHTPITPKSRSGAASPKSSRSWSGSITPRRQISVDEGVSETIPEITPTIPEELSGPQLMEKLSSLAAKSADFQERRHKFQKRQREDWRTRTQPVTLEEIQEADSLDSVSAFRAQVRRNASKNIFEHLKSQEQQRPLPTKATEFPQHLLPEKRKKRGRHQRHKTLPITAEELNAIPEGELAGPALRESHDVWKRDSRTDSGILSGSEVESLASDSLRSLSLEMDIPDNDPSRMSVSSKAVLFRNLDERAKAEKEKEKSASGAKRYIDRKKRERSRTQPVTDDEVKIAAEFADEKKQPPPVKMPQPEIVNRPKSPSVEEEPAEEEEDQLTKLSLAEKVKLFQQRQQEEVASKQPPPRAEAPVPRRRQRKHASRFNTQEMRLEVERPETTPDALMQCFASNGLCMTGSHGSLSSV